MQMTRIPSESERLRLQALNNLSECSRLAAYQGISAHRDAPDHESIGRSCAAGLTNVQKVRTKRINKETRRVKLARATFINVPMLRMADGTGRIPRKYQAKHLTK